jgi:MoxR-like ATPase
MPIVGRKSAAKKAAPKKAARKVTKAKVVDTTKSSKKILNGYYNVDPALYNIVKRNILKNVNTLFVGPTGVGKTELISNMAHDLNLPLTIFDMGTMTDPIMSLVGTHIISIKDGITISHFKKSRFSEVIQQPGIVLLDEITRASASANNLLFPCLDFRRELPMEYCFEDDKPIKIHPNCCFLATANMGGQYTGTHKMDAALLDRFMVIQVDPLTNDELVKTLSLYYTAGSKAVIDKIVNVYSSINKKHDEFAISFKLSMRHLKLICDLHRDGFTLYDSFYTICKGIGGDENKKIIEGLLSVVNEKATSTIPVPGITL